MKRASLYSAARPRAAPPAAARADAASPEPATPPAARASRLKSFGSRHQRPLLVAAGALLAVLLVALHAAMTPAPRRITQRDIDNAVRHSLETKPLPSRA